MFSYQSSQAHRERRRIFASTYSKTAISQSTVQTLMKKRISKLLRYLENQMDHATEKTGSSDPVVVRHVFRSLQADIFTAFAFSEAEGTTFLDNLKVGPYTMEDLGMGMMDLCHEDRRDAYFFLESETPFKYLLYPFHRSGHLAHTKTEVWLAELARKYELTTLSDFSTECVDCKPHLGDIEPHSRNSPYKKLCQWRDSMTGDSLTFKERASEILDHIIAGQDPVPAALEFILKQLSIHHGSQTILRSELSTSRQSIQDHGFAVIDKLAYLNAVVMEGLRLLDSTSSYQTRIVPSGGCVILGSFLPAGVSKRFFYAMTVMLTLRFRQSFRHNPISSTARPISFPTPNTSTRRAGCFPRLMISAWHAIYGHSLADREHALVENCL